MIFRNTAAVVHPHGRAAGDGCTLRETALRGRSTPPPSTRPRGKNRIRSMVESRPDWLISRQRAWGAPLAMFVDKEHRPAAARPGGQRPHRRGLRARRAPTPGSRADPQRTSSGDAHDPADYEKVEDILDVWFDSGSTHAFVLEQRARAAGWPADLYLEGSDQHRGWFQSSLLESCGTRGRAPYERVLTHGFILDEGGKMSKSLGNAVDAAGRDQATAAPTSCACGWP